jgi:hypothetical protein
LAVSNVYDRIDFSAKNTVYHIYMVLDSPSQHTQAAFVVWREIFASTTTFNDQYPNSSWTK